MIEHIAVNADSLVAPNIAKYYDTTIFGTPLENNLMCAPCSRDIVKLLLINGSPVLESALSIVSKCCSSFTITKPASVSAYCSGLKSVSRPRY
jgi:hypothetical protein